MQYPIHTWEIDEGNFVGGFLKQMKTITQFNTTNNFHAFEMRLNKVAFMLVEQVYVCLCYMLQISA